MKHRVVTYLCLELQIITGKPQDHEDLEKIRRVEGKKEENEKEIPQVEKNWKKQEKPSNETVVPVTGPGCYTSVYTSEYTSLPLTHNWWHFFPPEFMHDN